MRNLSKKKYINFTYDIMKEQGFKNVSIRKIASKLGVSSTSLYRHFDSLEHLKIYASLRYLRSYISDVSQLGRDAIFSIEGYFHYWELFAKYSFEEPEVYNLVFFMKHNYSLENLFRDYYVIFTEDLFDLDDALLEWLTLSDINTRCFITLKNAVHDDSISEEIIQKIADIHTFIYKGMLKDYFDGVPLTENSVNDFIDLCKAVFYSMII